MPSGCCRRRRRRRRRDELLAPIVYQAGPNNASPRPLARASLDAVARPRSRACDGRLWLVLVLTLTLFFTVGLCLPSTRCFSALEELACRLSPNYWL